VTRRSEVGDVVGWSTSVERSSAVSSSVTSDASFAAYGSIGSPMPCRSVMPFQFVVDLRRALVADLPERRGRRASRATGAGSSPWLRL
jgi:hypothetical protein